MGYPTAGSEVGSSPVGGQYPSPSPPPSPVGGVVIPEKTHVFDTTKLKNFLSNYVGNTVKSTGITTKDISGRTELNYYSHILWHVRNDNPEIYPIKAISGMSSFNITEKFLVELEGLKRDYSDRWPDFKESKEILSLRKSRLNTG